MTLASRSRLSRHSNTTASLSILIIAILSCAIPPRAAAHVQLSNPVPINAPKNPNSSPATADYDYTSPLSPDGSNFPCKGYHLTTPQSIATYEAGQTYTASLAGTATHTGGSCQFALSYDKGQSFHVIKSIIGGCPVQGSYDFTIPADAPSSDEALFAWTWVNREGNREFYMDCSWVTIEGTSTSEDGIDALPGIYVANIPSINDCKTQERQDVVFSKDSRGPDTEFGGGVDESAPATSGEECEWKGSSSGGSSGESTTPVAPSPKQSSSSDDHYDDDHSHDDSTDTDGHSHDDSTDTEASGSKPMIMAPGAAQAPYPDHSHYPGMDMSGIAADSVAEDEDGPPRTAVLGVLAYPSSSSSSRVAAASRRPAMVPPPMMPPPPGPPPQGMPIAQGSNVRPVAIGNPHPMALAGYDLMYVTDGPGTYPDADETVTVDVTEACPTDDAVVITVTASCTSQMPDVTVTVIGSTVTVRPSMSRPKSTITMRRSTIYSVISGTRRSSAAATASASATAMPCPPGYRSTWLSGMATCVPNSGGASSSWKTSLRPSQSPPVNPPPGGNGAGLGYATDTSQYMPCVPGTFLCTSASQFLTCDQTHSQQGGWIWMAPRAVAAGMMCKPNLVAGVGYGQMPAVPAGWHREDQYVREGS